MTTTFTSKNIADDVYVRLKAAAELHRRSINSEAIVCLEAALVPTEVTPAERLARARELRATLGSTGFDAGDIDEMKRFEQACSLQFEAQDLLTGLEYDVDSRAVFELVRASDCSACDCEFIALAEQLDALLVTMDKKFLRAFPERAVGLPAPC